MDRSEDEELRNDEKLRAAGVYVFRMNAKDSPRGKRRKFTTMAQQEAAEARRRWLLTAGALLLALIVGILIGRYLLP
jgi:hypothetical protein